MKRLLSLILSFSVLCGSAPSPVDAKTNFINNNRACIYKSRDGERVWVQGDKLPNFYINNKNENKAIANSYGGGSSTFKTIMTVIKVVLGVAALKYAISLLKSLGAGLLRSLNDISEKLKNANVEGNSKENGLKGDEENDSKTEENRGSFFNWGKMVEPLMFLSIIFSNFGQLTSNWFKN